MYWQTVRCNKIISFYTSFLYHVMFQHFFVIIIYSSWNILEYRHVYIWNFVKPLRYTDSQTHQQLQFIWHWIFWVTYCFYLSICEIVPFFCFWWGRSGKKLLQFLPCINFNFRIEEIQFPRPVCMSYVAKFVSRYIKTNFKIKWQIEVKVNINSSLEQAMYSQGE